ncbi:MAG: 6-phospho-beta-glucosidase [Chloroflexota bacterium]
MLKVAVIGGGSTYTPELINGFLERWDSFPLDELWLMDIDKERLDIVGGFAQRMLESRGSLFEVVLSTDQRQAIEGTSYVITQLRVGQMPARREDEYLGLRHGLIGQETTGVGGMAKALRTIPVMLQIAKDMHEIAAGALLVNFTNPSGLITEALFRHAPDVPSVGVCNVALTTKMEILEGIKNKTGEVINPDRAHLKTLGLNHLSWHYGFEVDGVDMWEMILSAYIEQLKQEPDPEFDVRTIEILGMIPNYYLRYFYNTQKMLKEQKHWPPSRAEEVLEIEKDLLRDYADPERKEPPEDLMKRGGAYYSTVAIQLLDAHYNNLDEVHVANVRQAGAVAGWDPDWVLEMPCRVHGDGIHALPAEPLPEVCFGLLAQVKAYELLTVEAAVCGDRKAAYQALLAHPLGPSADKIQEVLDDMLETNRAYLPAFFE